MQQPVTELDTRFSDQNAVATDWEETRRALQNAELFWITTVRADGRPHVTPLVAAWLDDTIHFATGAGEQKAVNLRTNQNVILTTGCNQWEQGLDVVVEGEAVQVIDESVLKQLAEAWAGKWDGRWHYEVHHRSFRHEGSDEVLVLSDIRELAQRIALVAGDSVRSIPDVEEEGRVSVPVTVENFVRAETDRMFAALQADAGGVNRLNHNRVPTPIEHQTVIRMNRDTLYSFALVDISEGVTVRVPDSGDRYVSVMVVNEDHYVNRVVHDPGEYSLTVDEFDTPWVGVAVRVLVDPADPADVAAVNALQDKFVVDATSSQPFEMPDYDTQSFDETRRAVLELAKHCAGFEHAFGSREQVEPIRHLVGTAAGWGGLPDQEARYVNVAGGPEGEYKLTVRDVPVDGFWSISVYNADGFFEPNDRNAYTVNNITANRNDDGSVTVHFGGCSEDRSNCLPITDGWNYIARLYRPRPEVIDGSWVFPALEPA